MQTRREFIKASLLASGAIYLSWPGWTKADGTKAMSEHPGLLFSKTELPEIQNRLELPIFKDFWQEMLNANMAEDRKFLDQEIQFNNQLHHLQRANQILQREAFIYVITKDDNRAELARLAIEKILHFQKWDYFLEAGQYVIGLQRAPFTTQSLVLAFDWLADFLTEAEKAAILSQLPEKGCEPCYRSLWGMLHQDQVVGWGFDRESSFYEERDMRQWPKILSRTNLRAVPMSALGLGAILLTGHDDRAERWLKTVKETYDAFVDLFAPDGSYPEGTGYCRYSSEELILFLDILKRHRGQDWSRAVNWPGVMDFLLMTHMPSTHHPKGHVNFGDGGHGFGSDIGFWIARHFKDGQAQYAAKNHSTSHKVFSVIWYDEKIKEKKPVGNWHYRHFDIGWVVVSTGFTPDDLVIALRSGPPANHENADRNSLILKCHAENLLVDNWHPPYNHLHPAWTLRTSSAHNTVLIDGKGHQYHDGKEGTNASLAEARVIQEKRTKNYAIVHSDATQAFRLVNENVKQVQRAVLVIPMLKFLVVVDTLKTENAPATFTARWFIDNEDKKGVITVQDNRFEFIRPQAKLVGVSAGSTGVQLLQGKFPVPEEHGIFPHLDVNAADVGTQVTIISAMAACKSQEPAPAMQIERRDLVWHIQAKIENRKINVTLATEVTPVQFKVKLI